MQTDPPPRPEIGAPAPPFELPRLDQPGSLDLVSRKGRPVVVTFWSAECPISRRFDPYFEGLILEYGTAVTVLAIDSNAIYDDSHIRASYAERGLTIPLARDADHGVADAYGALTTPHVFLVDADGRLAYAGAPDDRTFGRSAPSVDYLRRAIDAVMAGRAPDPPMTQPFGCTIEREPYPE